MLVGLVCFFSGAAAVLGLLSLHAGRKQLRWVVRALERQPDSAGVPPATLIVPVKGPEQGLARNLRSLVEQDHPDFELIVVVQSVSDPAVEEIQEVLGSAGKLVIGGPGPQDTGEKVGNLLAAVKQSRASSEVLAFADSDGCVERGWLRALVSPLRDPAVGAATGYRWYFPEVGGFWPLVRSAWNATIAGNFGPGPPSFAWGGAMALRRETFEKARVADFWRGTVSDDYRLSEAVRAAGLPIVFVPGAMVATAGQCTAREFLGWAVRQLIITRVYRPGLWWGGLAANVVYCGAMVTGVAAMATGRLWALALLLLSIAPGMWRGWLRRQAAERMFAGRSKWFARYGWVYVWLSPLVTWLWLLVLLASLVRRRIEWRGNVYELRSASETRVIESE